MSTVYKVVYVNKAGRLQSALAFEGLPRTYVRRYRPGRWTTPKAGTLLFAFAGLAQAKQWRPYGLTLIGTGFQLWEAESDKHLDLTRCAYTTLYSIKRFWRWKNPFSACRGTRGETEVGGPEGSVLCDKIKLVRQIV